MQLTERHLIKPSHKLYQTLDDLTFKAKNLYNHGLYLYRQSYFAHKNDPKTPILSWMDIDRNLRQEGHDDIRNLPSKVASAVLKNLGEALSSYWKLVNLKRNGAIAQKPKLPRYLHKTNGRYPLSFNYQTFGKVRGSNKELILCPKGLHIPIPTRVDDPKQVRIIPKHGNFIIEVVYEVEEPVSNTTSQYAGIDLGVDNFATVTFSTKNQPLIIKGLELKSINQGYNRLIAKAQLLLPDSQKTRLPLGKIVNQRFAHLPYETFIDQLRYKCRLRGIVVITQEESYTSKASFLDNDDIPVYGEAEKPIFSGQRIKRGLYRTNDGRLINADVNGSYNIMRKGLMANHQVLHIDSPMIKPLVMKGIGQEPNKNLVQSYVTLNVCEGLGVP